MNLRRRVHDLRDLFPIGRVSRVASFILSAKQESEDPQAPRSSDRSRHASKIATTGLRRASSPLSRRNLVSGVIYPLNPRTRNLVGPAAELGTRAFVVVGGSSDYQRDAARYRKMILRGKSDPAIAVVVWDPIGGWIAAG